MKIKTNTPQLFRYRKMILELLLASHCRDCTTCPKNGKCRLQELALRFGIDSVRFENTKKEAVVDDSALSIIRDSSKCILCGDCVRMCSEIQNVGAIDFAYRGSDMTVSTAWGKPLAETNCVNCGQCASVCPTGAIVIRNCTQKFWDAIYDDSKRVVVQFAPDVMPNGISAASGSTSSKTMPACFRMLANSCVVITPSVSREPSS